MKKINKRKLLDDFRDEVDCHIGTNEFMANRTDKICIDGWLSLNELKELLYLLCLEDG